MRGGSEKGGLRGGVDRVLMAREREGVSDERVCADRVCVCVCVY